jgi:hypothetical protein
MPPPAPDPVSLVFRALPFGMAVGVGCQALVTWTVRTVQLGAPATPTTSLGSTPAVVLLVGTLAGIVLAGVACWRVLSPIGNPWRQTMLSLIAGLGSFALSLVTLPIDRRFGRPGLLMLAGICGLIALLLVRRAPTVGQEP